MITLNITAETPDEIVEKLKGLLAHVVQFVPHPQPIQNPAPAITTQPAAPVFTAPAAPVAPMAPPSPPPVPTAAAPAFTLDQIMRAGSDLLTARPDLMPQLMAMPAKYAVQTLAQLKPEQFGAVATELRQLGAKI
jgi:hypothetical protein